MATSRIRTPVTVRPRGFPAPPCRSRPGCSALSPTCCIARLCQLCSPRLPSLVGASLGHGRRNYASPLVAVLSDGSPERRIRTYPVDLRLGRYLHGHLLATHL